MSVADIVLAGEPDRLRIFVSSTIGECADQRTQALAAIAALDQEHFVFEREGARSYGPRSLYLGKLKTCQLAIGIYRSSYGWVDETNGQTLSGLEDEFREIERLRLDLLAYIEEGVERDPRLAAIIAEILECRTAHFFKAGDDLTARIRTDILTIMAQGYARRRIEANQRAIAPQLTIDALFKSVPVRIRRQAVEAAIAELASLNRAFWVIGAPGAGKTVALAEFAAARGCAYVNARGLEPRAVLAKAADALAGREADDASSPATFEEACTDFADAWENSERWPLLIDDPADLDAVWRQISSRLAASAKGAVGLATREVPAALGGARFEIQGFTPAELDQLEALVDADARRNLAALRGRDPGTLPLDVRGALVPLRAREGDGTPIARRFGQLSGTERDIVAALALAGGPLSLDDLAAAGLGGMVRGDLYDLARGLDDLLVEDAVGFSIVHDSWAEEIAAALEARPHLRQAVGERLVSLFEDSGRPWRAFSVARLVDLQLAVSLAEQSLREIYFSGSVRNTIDAQEYLIGQYRIDGEQGPLVHLLVSLTQVASHARSESECWSFLDEALAVATAMEDEEVLQYVEEFRARYRLQTAPTPQSLEAVATLRRRHLEQGRSHSAAQLLIDEGVAFMAINDGDKATVRFRRALALFEETDDDYGVEIATRNLASLLFSEGGEAAKEAESLLASLPLDDISATRHRAWLCNTLNKRYRGEKRYAEAEAVAREAIEIGEGLGDRYVCAINWMALGNTLRDSGQLDAAIEAYGTAGREAQAISRPEIDGRAARLAAACHNTLAEEHEDRRADQAGQAEHFALYAIGRLDGSLASYDLADAWDELANARELLDKMESAHEARARAIELFGYAGEPEIVTTRLRGLAHALCDRPFDEAMTRTLEAFGRRPDPSMHRLEQWLDVAELALSEAEPDAASSIFALLMRQFRRATPPAFRMLALDGLFRKIADRGIKARAGHRSRLFFNSLAILAADRPSRVEWLRLASLCLEGDRSLRMRTLPGAGLHQIVSIGERQQFLFTVHTLDDSDDTYMFALYLGSFLAGFGADIERDFLEPNGAENMTLEIFVGGVGEVPEDLAPAIADGLEENPYVLMSPEPRAGEQPMIVAMAGVHFASDMRLNEERVGEFELAGVELLSTILQIFFGVRMSDEPYRSASRRLVRRLVW